MDGSGASGDTRHLTGWADPAVTEVVLQLGSGERLRLPAVAGQLALGYVVFALPGDAEDLRRFAEDLRSID